MAGVGREHSGICLIRAPISLMSALPSRPDHLPRTPSHCERDTNIPSIVPFPLSQPIFRPLQTALLFSNILCFFGLCYFMSLFSLPVKLLIHLSKPSSNVISFVKPSMILLYIVVSSPLCAPKACFTIPIIMLSHCFIIISILF